MKMSVKDRLIEFIRYNNLSQASFERRVGLSNGFVNNIGDTIRQVSIDKIKKEFPQINVNWLLVGVGAMIGECTAENGEETEALKKEIAQLKKKLKEAEETIAQKDEIINVMKAQLVGSAI